LYSWTIGPEQSTCKLPKVAQKLETKYIIEIPFYYTLKTLMA
jgi:hypothetical protein